MDNTNDDGEDHQDGIDDDNDGYQDSRPTDLPPLIVAAATWLGGWRPSAILSIAPFLAGEPAGPNRYCRRFLDRAIRRFKTEEAFLDEKLTGLRSTSLLHVDTNAKSALANLAKEAQRLRHVAVEIAVHRVLNGQQAAEFLRRLEGFGHALKDISNRG
ncbi:seed dormancy control protein [Wolffia australiana]